MIWTMRSIPRVLAFSLLLSLLFLGIRRFSHKNPWGTSIGFPFTYSFPNPPTCGNINPFNGCGYSYDPMLIGLDYLFWIAVALVSVLALDIAWTRLSKKTAA